MAALEDITAYCNRLLAIDAVSDYCPNGLQIEGRREISRIVCGVTASVALIDRAISVNACALLVHHGYFWRGEPQVLCGMKYQRVKQLINHEIALLAYHLPLDIHPEVGNNAQLGKALALQEVSCLEAGGTPGLFWHGTLDTEITAKELTDRIAAITGRAPLFVGPVDRPIKSVGWCTGGAQQFIDIAADLSLDAYISGEISEQTTHVAREREIGYFAAGHHATERLGVQALGKQLQEQFDVQCEFIDIPNPA